jgi:hypothetical protein
MFEMYENATYIQKKTNQSRRRKLSVTSQRNQKQISVQCMGVDNLWSQMSNGTLYYIVPHEF